MNLGLSLQSHLFECESKGIVRYDIDWAHDVDSAGSGAENITQCNGRSVRPPRRETGRAANDLHEFWERVVYLGIERDGGGMADAHSHDTQPTGREACGEVRTLCLERPCRDSSRGAAKEQEVGGDKSDREGRDCNRDEVQSKDGHEKSPERGGHEAPSARRQHRERSPSARSGKLAKEAIQQHADHSLGRVTRSGHISRDLLREYVRSQEQSMV